MESRLFMREVNNMRKWWEFVIETNKRSRSSGRGLEKSLKWFLDKGPQKKGGYSDKDRPNFSRKKFNDISAPPGAPGGLEEEVEPDSFDPQKTLEPHIWLTDDEMNPDVKERLITIAEDFIQGLEIDVPIVDVRLTGSIANYNWSDYSDIDLHIVVDYSQLDSDEEIVKKFFDASRLRWNDRHNISIYGYEVEVYVENVNEDHQSSGIYSLLHGEWLVEPDPQDVKNAWTVTARKKSDDIMTQINLIQRLVAHKPKAAIPKEKNQSYAENRT